jgi:hypothetical protein
MRHVLGGLCAKVGQVKSRESRNSCSYNSMYFVQPLFGLPPPKCVWLKKNPYSLHDLVPSRKYVEVFVLGPLLFGIQSIPKPVASRLIASSMYFFNSSLDLYMGRSMRLKHVCARGKTCTFLSPCKVNFLILPSFP